MPFQRSYEGGEMIYLGIVIGIVGMMAFNFAISMLINRPGKQYNDAMRELMVEGNRLREERNAILDRIGDGIWIKGDK
jgi:hypothetical protein